MSGTPTDIEPAAPDPSARPARRASPADGRGTSVRETSPGSAGSGRRAQARPPRRRAPVMLSASVTAGWAALLSYGSVLLVVGLLAVISGGSSAPATIRLSTAGWLLAHGVPIGTSIGAVSLTPLAVTALAIWRVLRAGVHTSRAVGGRRHGNVRLVGVAALAVALAYGLLGTCVAALAGAPGLALSPLRAGLTLTLVGLVASGAGALYDAGLARAWWLRLPEVVRDGLRTGIVAALLVFGSGAGLAGLAVAVAGGDVADTLSGYRTGVAGQAGLTLLCLVYAPNLAGWAMAYAIGPGFGVGIGTTVSVAAVHLGALPAVPVLAAVPGSAVAGFGMLILGLPVVAAVVAGWLLARRMIRQRGGCHLVDWAPLLGAAMLAGPVGGMALGVLGWVSGGGLGAGRLSHLGPDPWWLTLIGTGVVALGVVVGAAATRILMGVRAR